ncbi:3715_t:CDS:10, partial [Funneliformis caledonium]
FLNCQGSVSQPTAGIVGVPFLFDSFSRWVPFLAFCSSVAGVHVGCTSGAVPCAFLARFYAFLARSSKEPETQKFWKIVKLERDLENEFENKKIIVKRKLQIDGLDLVHVSRQQQNFELVDELNSEIRKKPCFKFDDDFLLPKTSPTKRKKQLSLKKKHEQVKITDEGNAEMIDTGNPIASRSSNDVISPRDDKSSTPTHQMYSTTTNRLLKEEQRDKSTFSQSSESIGIGARSSNDVISLRDDRPSTPTHQIYSTTTNQDILDRLLKEKQRAKSTFEPICSNIIDTTNKHSMDRLEIKRDYTWVSVINEATKYIDELIDNFDTRDKFRSKLQLPFVPPDEIYSFNKHYEMNWVKDLLHNKSLYLLSYRLSFFEAPRNPLLDKHSEGWLNCHILTLLIDDCFLTCEEIQVHRGEEMSLASNERKNLSREESEKKQPGHKIDILFRIDDMEYFGSETYVDEDPQNSKPISYKQKLFREMKDQLDRLLKKLKFTRETIKEIKNIAIHGINQGGLNGKIYTSVSGETIFQHPKLSETLNLERFLQIKLAKLVSPETLIYTMYYDADLQHYFVFETCQYRIGTTWGNIPESLVSLKNILCLKS